MPWRRMRSPRSGSISPAMIFSSVDLPEPLRPTSASRSPSPTVSSTSASSGCRPKPKRDVLREERRGAGIGEVDDRRKACAACPSPLWGRVGRGASQYVTLDDPCPAPPHKGERCALAASSIPPASPAAAPAPARCRSPASARRSGGRAPARAVTSASISIGRPRSRSCSIEVLCAPTAAAPAMRLSTSIGNVTPERARRSPPPRPSWRARRRACPRRRRSRRACRRSAPRSG